MPAMESRPWCVQVELTEGCNRLCPFCGLNAIRDAPGNYLHMSEDTAFKAAAQLEALCPTARMELAMHGEPLQNPNARKLVNTFRSWLPEMQIQLTTNGKVLAKRMQQRLEQLFRAGVDYVVMDTYRPERDALRAEAATLRDITVIDFYAEGNTFSPWHNHRRKVQRTVVLMDDLLHVSGQKKQRVIRNHAGSNPMLGPIAEPLKATCTLPFRELTITHAGDVRVCCEDWTGKLTLGNLHQQSLTEIWFGPGFEAARTMLQNKDRNFGPCAGCDNAGGPRKGLLPKYPAPTAATRQLLRSLERAPLVQLGKRRPDVHPSPSEGEPHHCH